MRTFKTIEINIHPAGWPFIAGFAAVALLLYAISGVLGTIGLVLTVWCVYFFRDPDRITPNRPGLIIAPADGMVQSIVTLPAAPPELGLPEGPYNRVAIFMSVFDVHVNRFPLPGVVTGKTYIPGKFLNAALDKASEDNERLALRVKLDETAGKYANTEIGVVQIAGLIARRILCFVDVGHKATTGERFGLIRFGSRVDVFLPTEIPVQVIVGQRMVAGESVIADLTSSEPSRTGTVN